MQIVFLIYLYLSLFKIYAYNVNIDFVYRGERMKKKIACLFGFLVLFSCNQKSCFALSETVNINDAVFKKYEKVTNDPNLIKALELLDRTSGKYSKEAILGKNLTNRPVKVEFINLSQISPAYANFDALGWKKKKNLFIYINEKHKDAPSEALSAILAHEAIHQDEENSLNEETYAWTLEAAVWTELTEDAPHLEKISHPLVDRENVIKKLFIRGKYTNEYIRKFVITNKGYQNLPQKSKGFEELL